MVRTEKRLRDAPRSKTSAESMRSERPKPVSSGYSYWSAIRKAAAESYLEGSASENAPDTPMATCHYEPRKTPDRYSPLSHAGTESFVSRLSDSHANGCRSPFVHACRPSTHPAPAGSAAHVFQVPITPPSSLVITTVAERGRPPSASGHWLKDSGLAAMYSSMDAPAGKAGRFG